MYEGIYKTFRHATITLQNLYLAQGKHHTNIITPNNGTSS